VNLVDSCGWLEYLADGPNADFYAGSLTDTGNLVVPSICIAEVFRKVLLLRGEGAAFEAAALMMRGQVVVLEASIAVLAARLGSEFKMPLADSIILATARSWNAVIWTQDSHFKDIPGVRYIEKH
jgi:predicted nucleic acid-binding protein